jgi:glycosyltransferase involved in cell wall biosynthesis
MKLSLCIPAYNEEKNIHIPLSSAIDLVDEVVVIDASSTDKTAEIAKSFGKKVKVFQTNNPRNFLENKVRAIEKAKGEWILQLDADEALSEELKKEILDILKNKNEKIKNKNDNEKLKMERYIGEEIVGYYMPRKNFFLTRFLMKGGVYPDYVLRLYKKDKASFDLKDLHENVKVNGKVAYLKNPILHYADPSFSRYLLRFDRYTTFDAEELLKKYPKEKLTKVKEVFLFIDYFLIKPLFWFLKTYIRHKGFLDGFAGFVFCLFSSIRFWVIFIKYKTIIANQK